MKFTIEFESEEEALEVLKARTDARQYKTSTDAFENYLRSQIKHGEHHAEALRVLETVREEFYNYYDHLV